MLYFSKILQCGDRLLVDTQRWAGGNTDYGVFCEQLDDFLNVDIENNAKSVRRSLSKYSKVLELPSVKSKNPTIYGVS